MRSSTTFSDLQIADYVEEWSTKTRFLKKDTYVTKTCLMVL